MAVVVAFLVCAGGQVMMAFGGMYMQGNFNTYLCFSEYLNCGSYCIGMNDILNRDQYGNCPPYSIQIKSMHCAICALNSTTVWDAQSNAYANYSIGIVLMVFGVLVVLVSLPCFCIG